jgi:hypothetical protein
MILIYYLRSLRLFERGEISFRELFPGPVTTFESNIAYELRFMIDTKVSELLPSLSTLLISAIRLSV